MDEIGIQIINCLLAVTKYVSLNERLMGIKVKYFDEFHSGRLFVEHTLIYSHMRYISVFVH